MDPHAPANGTSVEYQNVVADLNNMFDAAIEQSEPDGLLDLSTNSYATPHSSVARDPQSLLASIERSLEGNIVTPYSRSKSQRTGFSTPRRIAEQEEQNAESNTAPPPATSYEDLFRGGDVQALANKFGISYEEADAELARNNDNVYSATRSLIKKADPREQALNQHHITNVMEDTLRQELPAPLALAAEKGDDEDFGPTGTFKNPYEKVSVPIAILSDRASQTPNGLNISNGAPQSNPSAGFRQKIEAQVNDSPDIYEFGTPTVREGPTFGSGILAGRTTERKRSKSAERLRNVVASAGRSGGRTPSRNIDMATFMSDYGNTDKESPDSLSRSTGYRGASVNSRSTPVTPRAIRDELKTPRGNKVPTYRI
jgi:hypothetical protein